MRRHAFTLIELLVVIAIIAILAAILLPVLTQAKEAAKKTTGVAHIKQMNLAVIMYASDYEDTFPLANRALPPSWNAMLWILDVYPYTKSLDIFLNPQGPPNPVNNLDWKYVGGTYGTIPNAAIKNVPYYTVSNFPITRVLNIVGARHGGVMGSWNVPPGDPNYGRGCWGACTNNGRSKTMTELSNPADTALIFDAGEPTADFTTFADPALGLGICVRGRESYNPGGTTLAGATPRWSGGPRSCAGWRPPDGGSAAIPEDKARLILKGQANIGFTDGSVRSMGMSRLYRTEACEGDPGNRCMVHLPID